MIFIKDKSISQGSNHFLQPRRSTRHCQRWLNLQLNTQKNSCSAITPS